MKKSKYVFLIFAVLYVFIVVLDICNFVEISENVLVGLSFSAFLMSLGDVCSSLETYRFARNELRFICLVTSNALQEFISGGISSHSGVNINNLMKNIKLLENNYKLGIHPSYYYSNRTNRVLHIISAICFVLAITVFVLTPFFSVDFDNRQISVGITLLAFSVMCFNIFVSERIDECVDKRNNFMNNTQLIVNSVKPDFSMWLNKNLYYYEDLAAGEEKMKK